MITLLLAIAFTELAFNGLTLTVLWQFLLIHPFVALFILLELLSYKKVTFDINIRGGGEKQ
jgi:hypothetical protein